MKKRTQILSMLTLMALTAALFGCSAKDQAPSTTPTESTETPADDAASTEPDQNAAADGALIQPLPSAFDPTNLEDCVFPVSFTNDDIELNDEGTLVLHMTIWEQELFDAVEIAGLEAGDTILVRGEEIPVASVESVDSFIHINGGVEEGGVTLAPSESGGTFYESLAELIPNDKLYVSVAQLALPVDGDNFVYTDTSDLEKGEETYLAGDLLTQKDEVDFSCLAFNGTVHIVNNQVAEIVRVYAP